MQTFFFAWFLFIKSFKREGKNINKKIANEVQLSGGTTATPSNSTNHNHTTASNFKRQNTVDSATIKENTARINSGSGATRPTVAKNAVNITSIDSSVYF